MAITQSEVTKFLSSIVKKTVRKNKDELDFLL